MRHWRTVRTYSGTSAYTSAHFSGGVTVDIVTPDGKIATGKVNSQSIEDDSVQLQDLSPEAREAMENNFATDDDVKAALGL